MEGSWRQEVSIPSYKCFRALLNSLSVPEGKNCLSLTAEAKMKREGTTMSRHVPIDMADGMLLESKILSSHFLKQ